jgi:aspartyl-tRNA(Asn)/glutamyl-tRNA(Gln) amidotransferase subunit A
MHETLSDAVAAVRAGAVTSGRLVDEALAAADARDAELGVFLARFDAAARAAAHDADAAVAAGRPLGPLHGAPVAVKDLLATHEGPTTAQSRVSDPAWGAEDAVAVARLRAAGAIVVGKTTTAEHAIGPPDAATPFPVPRNPWDPARYAGGSSSGSASGLVAGMFLGALGTDTGASIRMPAAFCGVTGLKPTFGRVPTTGCWPLAWSLDCVGPMARTARDCALLLDVLTGLDVHAGALDGDLRGVRVGLDPLVDHAGAWMDPAVEPALRAAAAALADRGADVVDVALPHYADLTTAAMVTFLSEGAAFHRRNLQERWHEYGASTRAALGAAVLLTGADYVQASARCRWSARPSWAPSWARRSSRPTGTRSACRR